MKISLVGAGNIGGMLAMLLVKAGTEEIVLFDIVEGLPDGKALDLEQAAALAGSKVSLLGTSSYDDIAGSDIVVVSAGFPRKPGMSRENLFEKNKAVISQVSRNIRKHAPDSVVIVVTNPLDLMALVALKETGFPKQRVMGMAGVLDSARLKQFISEKAGCSPAEVNAMVLGSHGDSMVPVLSHTTVRGKPVADVLSSKDIEDAVERTRNAGAEIVSLLKTGSAFFAPAQSILEMTESIARDSRKTLPVSVFLEGEYGQSGIFTGVPCVIGKNGAEKIVELEFSEDEQEQFNASASAARENAKKFGLL